MKLIFINSNEIKIIWSAYSAHCILFYAHIVTQGFLSHKSFEFLRDRQRYRGHQLTWRKSLNCGELLVSFGAGISVRIQAEITEVCFNLNNDFQSWTKRGTFLCVTPLNMSPFRFSDRSLCLSEHVLERLVG